MPRLEAPVDRAASRMSVGWLWRPARMMSIMNGDHCQTRTVTMDQNG